MRKKKNQPHSQPTVNVNFAGTGFVSLIDKDGNAVQKTEVVCNMVTKEILWQLNHGKQPIGTHNPFDIQQMFANCALGDGNIDGTLLPYATDYDIKANEKLQDGGTPDIARKTTLDMFHLDNARTKFQDEYYTAEGFCGCSDCWTPGSRNYAFKFRRSYKFNLIKDVEKFICREIGLFAQPSDLVGETRGKYKKSQDWLAGKSKDEYAYPYDAEDGTYEVQNRFGYPFDMTARLVLPTPLVVDLTQAVVVTYDFTMSIDCSTKNSFVNFVNNRTGEVEPRQVKIGFDFKCDERTSFGQFKTLPAPNAKSDEKLGSPPGILWNTVANNGYLNSVNVKIDSKESDSEESGNNKGFLSNNATDGSSDYIACRFKDGYEIEDGEAKFLESAMNANNPGTLVPSDGEPNLYSSVKINHARFQATYVYEARLPYREAAEPTLYPSEFNIGGIRLWFEPIEYANGELLSPIEWRPGRQFFIAVAVTMSFRNETDEGVELDSDRDLIMQDLGFASVEEINKFVYKTPSDSSERDEEDLLDIKECSEGDKGYLLKTGGAEFMLAFSYFPVYLKNLGGSLRWHLDDDLPAGGEVVYHNWNKVMEFPYHKKPYRRGFMLDDRDGNVYMCLYAHFANSQTGMNKYGWVHAEPFRLRAIGSDYGGGIIEADRLTPIGVMIEDEGLAENAFGVKALSDSHGKGMHREQALGRLYALEELLNRQPKESLPKFREEMESAEDWFVYLRLDHTDDDGENYEYLKADAKGIAPIGWHVPSDAELCAFFHGQAKGSGDKGTEKPSGIDRVEQLFMLRLKGDDKDCSDCFGFNWRYPDGSELKIGSSSVIEKMEDVKEEIAEGELETELTGYKGSCFALEAGKPSLERKVLELAERVTLFCFKD